MSYDFNDHAYEARKRREAENKQCPYCQQYVKFLHKHQTAYGMPETHFPGTEHFTCPNCNVLLTRDEAVNSGCIYVLDVEEK